MEGEGVIDLDLFDVSVVTYPAYLDTDCELKSAGERREKLAFANHRVSRDQHMARQIRILDLDLAR
jgi:phage head maturation protease